MSAENCKNCGIDRSLDSHGTYCEDCRRIGGRGIIVGVVLAEALTTVVIITALLLGVCR